MRNLFHRYLLLVVLVAMTPLLAACGLAHRGAPAGSSSTPTPAQASPGERQGTIPASARAEGQPPNPAASPQAAVQRFAVQYINWTYATLAASEGQLAGEAVGEARTVERQAQAQTGRDAPIQRAHIYNRGTIVAVSHASGGPPNEWVVVSREQTGGDQEYAGLRAAFHVTLAEVQRVAGGWAVSAWRPQV